MKYSQPADKKGGIAHKPKTHLFANFTAFPHLPVEFNSPSLLLPHLQLFPPFRDLHQKNLKQKYFQLVFLIGYIIISFTQYGVSFQND